MLLRISPAAGFHHSCISISFTISFVICVQTVTNAVKKNFVCGGLFRIFLFREFLAPLQKLIPIYATARDCTICIYERPRELSKRFVTPKGKKDPQLQILDPLMSSGRRIF